MPDEAPVNGPIREDRLQPEAHRGFQDGFCFAERVRWGCFALDILRALADFAGLDGPRFQGGRGLCRAYGRDAPVGVADVDEGLSSVSGWAPLLRPALEIGGAISVILERDQ